jgi:hypothetical protein
VGKNTLRFLMHQWVMDELLTEVPSFPSLPLDCREFADAALAVVAPLRWLQPLVAAAEAGLSASDVLAGVSVHTATRESASVRLSDAMTVARSMLSSTRVMVIAKTPSTSWLFAAEGPYAAVHPLNRLPDTAFDELRDRDFQALLKDRVMIMRMPHGGHDTWLVAGPADLADCRLVAWPDRITTSFTLPACLAVYSAMPRLREVDLHGFHLRAADVADVPLGPTVRVLKVSVANTGTGKLLLRRLASSACLCDLRTLHLSGVEGVEAGEWAAVWRSGVSLQEVQLTDCGGCPSSMSGLAQALRERWEVGPLGNLPHVALVTHRCGRGAAEAQAVRMLWAAGVASPGALADVGFGVGLEPADFAAVSRDAASVVTEPWASAAELGEAVAPHSLHSRRQANCGPLIAVAHRQSCLHARGLARLLFDSDAELAPGSRVDAEVADLHALAHAQLFGWRPTHHGPWLVPTVATGAVTAGWLAGCAWGRRRAAVVSCWV